MAYLIAERRCSAEAVFDELKRARPVCDPNLGYWVTLKEWEQQLGIEAEPERRGEPGASTPPARPARSSTSSSPPRPQ